mmetsp:Transcript_15161/g.18282  ORF Transcript_15161/g.18282 Transcript_15161/m.18282 type:complete len:575 (-) Transcript_15161:418-2142(-)|eukprot:CAMPEP_0197848584 /NCGR_PEP_ID=MMETSP1438-20131217/9202_1 /TAXON_ID=1461541 /ORGANISM="Pterosperma sp., Strain CCMP1384" /LENGTH=574 /DNA_ID=CAMNT_0043460907 /DNA_START=290 /DNA_END=2014 /DNA_ORIENTATION=+
MNGYGHYEDPMTVLPPPEAPVFPAHETTPAPPVAPALALGRNEVVMTMEQAKQKKLGKGYALEPVLPQLTVPDPALESGLGKRARKATPKAIEAKTVSRTLSRQQSTASTLSAAAATSSLSMASEDKEERRRARKEEKRRLLAELQQVRDAAREAEMQSRQLTGSEASPSFQHAQNNRGYQNGGAGATTSAAPTAMPESMASSTSLPSPANSGLPTRDMPAKRTPKVNPSYQSEDFVTGNKLPPPEKIANNKGKKRPAKDSKQPQNPRDAKRQKVDADRAGREARLMNLCTSILRAVSKHKKAIIFLEPVDAVVLGLADYHDIVKEPMDLGTIRTKLENKEYRDPYEFVADMRLVFHNCRLYNPPGNPALEMGNTVSDDFEKRWESAKVELKWQEEMNKRAQEEHEIANLPTESEYAQPAVHSNIQQIGSQLEELKKLIANQKAGGKPGQVRDDSIMMSFDEKRALSHQLQQLPSDKLGKVVKIIFGSDWGEDEEIELDIDQLDAPTLWKLHRYVQGCFKQPKKSKKASAFREDEDHLDIPDVNEPLDLPDIPDDFGHAQPASSGSSSSSGDSQ